MRITDIFQLIEQKLEDVKPETSSEKQTYIKAKAGITLLFKGVGLMLRLTRSPYKNIMEWVYYVAYKNIIELALEWMEKDPERKQMLVFHFPQGRAGDVPRLTVMRCETKHTDAGYEIVPIETAQPNDNLERTVNWYNSRKKPAADLAKVMILAEREKQPEKPADQ